MILSEILIDRIIWTRIISHFNQISFLFKLIHLFKWRAIVIKFHWNIIIASERMYLILIGDWESATWNESYLFTKTSIFPPKTVNIFELFCYIFLIIHTVPSSTLIWISFGSSFIRIFGLLKFISPFVEPLFFWIATYVFFAYPITEKI